MNLEEHKPAILAALARWRGQSVQPRDLEAAWTEIVDAASAAQATFERFQKLARRDGSGASRHDLFDQLAPRLAAVHKQLSAIQADDYLLQPLAWANGWESADGRSIDIDWSDVEAEIAFAVAYLNRLQKWAERGRAEAADAVIKNRIPTPRAHALDRLAWGLGRVYYDQTGRMPGVSRGSVATPFEDFVASVVHAIGLVVEDADGSRTAVQEAIKRVKHNQEFYFDMLEPTRVSGSAADTFREFLDRMGE